MVPMKLVLAIVFLTFAVFPALPEEKMAILGSGAQTCAKFADDYRRDPTFWEAVYFYWALGYMSGVNMERLRAGQPAHNLAGRPPADMQASLRLYCDRHPLALYTEAVMDLLSSLPKK
jgi:hypothetical protein